SLRVQVWLGCVFFFFSSRRRHTRSKRDWSSDVCSSDLEADSFNILAESLKRLLTSEFGKDIKGISFSGQMHGLVLIDESGEVIRPAILWNDTRTSQECREIIEEVGLSSLLEQVQNTVLEGFTLSKLMWVKKNEPENFERIHKFMLPKDYVIYRLTGNVYTEPSDAAGTVMFDVKEGTWSLPLLH